MDLLDCSDGEVQTGVAEGAGAALIMGWAWLRNVAGPALSTELHLRPSLGTSRLEARPKSTHTATPHMSWPESVYPGCTYTLAYSL